MRIAHVTATFPPYYSGTGLVCYHNALGLAQRGHQVTVFTAAHPPGVYPYPPELTVQRLPVAFRFGNAPLLPGLLRLKGFDLIHLHFPFYFGAELTAWAARRHHIPLVITYHQDVILASPLQAVATLHDWLLGNWTLRSAGRVLFTTLDYGRASKARWLFRAQSARVADLPNGVDAVQFHPALPSAPMRQRYGFPPEAIILIVVAGLDRAHYFKGLDILLRALAQTDAHLLVVGDGELRPRYQALAAELGLAERVIFAGHVSAEELPLCYAAADIGVLPSWTMGEAFGLTLLEAMACGKPVIASNLPGVRSVVEDRVSGLLCRPGDVADLADKIAQLLNDPPRRRALGARGRASVEVKYAWPKVVDALEAVYRAAVAAPPARQRFA